MKKKILFLAFLFIGISFHANSANFMPNFLIKTDLVGSLVNIDTIFSKKMSAYLNPGVRLTFALDPFFIPDEGKSQFRITPQLKMDVFYEIPHEPGDYTYKNELKIGLHGRLLVFEAGVLYEALHNEFTFDAKIKPEWNYFIFDPLGFSIAPFLSYETNFSSVHKITPGIELGFVFNLARKHGISMSPQQKKKPEQQEKEESEQQQAETRKESLRLARKIICKKYGFESEQEYLDWLNRMDSSNLINSLTMGNAYTNTFVVGDIIIMKPYMFSIGYMDYYGMDSFVYLVSLQGIGKYCKIISSHQIEYFDYTGGLISETLVLKFVGRGTYRQGYSIKECDTFEVVEKGTADYDAYVEKLNDIAEIEKNPHLYKDILGDDYDVE